MLDTPTAADVLRSILARHTPASSADAWRHVRETEVDADRLLFLGYLIQHGEVTDWPTGPEWERFQ